MGENVSEGDKNISFSLINVFFYGDRQAGWATRSVILTVSIETGMEKIRCIFNYQVSRVYAFPTLNTRTILS